MGALVKSKNSFRTNRRIITRMIIAFFSLSVVASCGFLTKNNQPQLDLTKLQLKKEIITFTFHKIPKIYSGLVKLDNEIVLTDKELERLKEIETEFPKQSKIISTERNNWQRVKKDLNSSLTNLEKEIEKIYVTYLVNKNKGRDLIKNNMKALLDTINKTLEASTPHTKRLIAVEKKSFWANLKNKLSG